MLLANTDNIGLGVSAVHMGRCLFCHLGFEEAEVVSVIEDEKERLSLWICILDQPSNQKGEKNGPDCIRSFCLHKLSFTVITENISNVEQNHRIVV